MYRIALILAYLAYSSAAPYASLNGQNQGSFQQDQVDQQPLVNYGQQQLQQSQQQLQQSQQQLPLQDESEVVDNTGAGYSYFKKQPIVSRPLIQQQVAVPDRSSLSSQDQFQWSDYMKSSAFKKQPVQQPFLPISNDQFQVGGYGQQQPALPIGKDQFQVGGYGQQQPALPMSNDQFQVGGYGQQQPALPISNDQVQVGGYGQQQKAIFRPQINTGSFQTFQDRLPQPIQNAYGSIDSRSQQPIVLNNNKKFGDSQLRAPLSTGYNNQQFTQQQEQQQQQFIPQQPSSLFQGMQQSFGNNIDDSSMQQQQSNQLIRPTILSIKSQSGYGQQPQVQPEPLNDQSIGTFGQQQLLTRPTIPFNNQQSLLRPAVDLQPKTFSNTYGNQQQDLSWQQPKVNFNVQQQHSGFVSSMKQGQQQPLTSAFLIQSRQQNDLQPVTSSFYASNVPDQRIVSQQQLPQQKLFQQQQQQSAFDSDSSNGGW